MLCALLHVLPGVAAADDAWAHMQGKAVFVNDFLSKYYFYGQIFNDSRIRVKHLLFD